MSSPDILARFSRVPLAGALLLVACGPSQPSEPQRTAQATAPLSEGFETGSKTGYADANVTLSSGVWDMNDCLIGTLSTDVKDGTAAARCRNSGTLTMQFDLTSGAGMFSIAHARFSADGNSTWALYHSTDGGTTWTQTGAPVTTSSSTVTTASFTVNVSGAVRFQVRKTDGSANRVDFDDVAITAYGGGGTGVGASGGTLSTLSFAIVGDTRPATINDTAGYPTAIITKIYQDLQAFSPRPAFAIATGDYIYASTSGTQQAPQFNAYLSARANFSNVLFPALGNHECTGYTTSNCGSGNADGTPANYTAFLSQMLGPINQTLPYYTINVNAADGSWTAKFVFIAANAWTSTQASWLGTQLARATTYTFIVRHEENAATTAPGVTPSNNIIAGYPYTLLLVGHSHTFSYTSSSKQVITGIGGAPLTGSVNYGYVIAQQRADQAMVLTAYDYATNQSFQTFAVKPDGSPTL